MSRVYFSPGADCQLTILSELKHAESYVDICVFTISDDAIAKAIKECFRRGVDVRIITDDDKVRDRGSDIRELRKAGIPVRMDDTPNHMHHKFAIVDGHTLLTGSYNWTRSAHKYNHENLLVTFDHDALDQYAEEFEKLWREFAPR